MALRHKAQGPMSKTELVQQVGVRASANGGPTLAGIEAALRQILEEHRVEWAPERATRAARHIADELWGLGPLGPLLRDEAVSEVMVNASGEVFVERAGLLEATEVRFASEEQVRHLVERVVSPLGLRADASSPWVDARLPDGSRFHAVLPPVALGGPVVCVRKFVDTGWTLTELVAMGSATSKEAVRLATAVRERANVLVSGGGGSGKTTLLGVLGRLVPSAERVVTIEDAAELRLGDRHVVSLETRPANVEGRGAVTLRDLVRCAMRMRADRIIVGEVRGAEALDMLQALTSGHAGSMATVHADDPEGALLRLETMAMLAAPGLSAEALRRQVASAFDLVVHLERETDGRRHLARIHEVRL